MILQEQCQRIVFSFDSVCEGGCGRHVPHVLPHSPSTREGLFSTCSHTSRWVRFRFGGRLSLVVAHVRRPWNYHHFAFSRLANLTHAVVARLRLSVPTWQHVHRRVLRELDIEFEPTRHWSSSFCTACSYYGSSRRFATATGRVRLTLPQNANSCSCASSTCALASESHALIRAQQPHRTQTARNIEPLAGASSIGTRWSSVSFSQKQNAFW